MTDAASVRQRRRLLRLGLPRDPAANSHIAAFLVTTLATVILVRLLLLATGFPQVGGGGAHVSHVLWGGLLMAVALLLQIVFMGPVIRSGVVLVGGVGFGLFVDEIGKFVTADYDYFWRPTAAVIYAVVVGLAIGAEALQRRHPRDRAELLAAAADHTVAGLVGGLSERDRETAYRYLEKAGDASGADEVRALLDSLQHDSDVLPNPFGAISHAVVSTTRRVVRERWAPWFTVGLLLLTSAVTLARGIYGWSGSDDEPSWIVVGIVVSALVSTTFAVIGLTRVGTDRESGYRWFRRAVLVSLLVTQIFLFQLSPWDAGIGLLLDLVVLGLVAAELDVLNGAEGTSPVR